MNRSTSITFNELCSLCEKIFSDYDMKNPNPQVSAFYSLDELQNSSHLSCHLCNCLVNSSWYRTNFAQARATLAAKNLKANVNRNPSPRTNLEAKLVRYGNSLYLTLVATEGAHGHEVAGVFFYVLDHPEKKIRFIDSPTTQSEDSWQQVLQWNQHCSQNHSNCRAQALLKDEWPTRLLDIGIAGTPMIRLRETSELDIPALSYTTLSHSWGNKMPIRLLSSNYSGFLQQIAIGDLPKTFQDAIEVTRKLGIPFLWIDSLCIIQDSNSDWVKESGRMHLVYRNSYLTIAAAAAGDAAGGLFSNRDPLSIVPCRIESGSSHQSRYVLSRYRIEEEERGESRSLVLFTRAWVFQERILSSRSVVFGGREIYWECLELKASEVYPREIPDLKNRLSSVIFNLRKEWNQIQKDSSVAPWKCWTALTSQYSSLKLSHISDKLVAIAGLAADLHKTRPDADYLAGIWSYRLRRGLLWRCHNPSPWRKPSYTAPSWSWASVDAKFSTDSQFSFCDGLAEVLDAQTSPLSLTNPFGMVTDGYVRLKAPLICSTLEKGEHENQWYIRAASSNESDSKFVTSSVYPFANTTINVMLDDRATNDSLQRFIAYLMPAEAILTEVVTGLQLQGLVLMPTHLKRGQFRRIGFFYLADFWNNDDSTIDDEISTRFKDWLGKLENGEAQGLHRNQDPYCNGIVNKTLLGRYEDLGVYFPKITSFLDLIPKIMQASLDTGEVNQALYEEAYSDGYAVFHII